MRDAQVALLDLAERIATLSSPGTRICSAPTSPVCALVSRVFRNAGARWGTTRRRAQAGQCITLGSAALAGTSYPIDRDAVARALGFDGISRNSLDAVSDRDFCIEFASTASLIMIHLSRLAEDTILYSTTEFGFFELSDAVATGSSLMPQKKESRLDGVGARQGRTSVRPSHGTARDDEGLPLAYNKDMQEDKEALFESLIPSTRVWP